MRYAVLSGVLLSACVAVPASVVSGYNGDTVTIQGPGLSATSGYAPDELALAKATCGGKATYMSSRMVSDTWVEELFLCR